MVMGILNVTPDSFFDGDRYNNKKQLVERLKQMVEEQVGIIDIGGYSSRPGAANISEQQEIDRVVPTIELARSLAPDIPLSIDTFRATVARASLDAGADMVNDISGGNLDPSMFRLIANRQVPYVLMHMRGEPRTMSSKTNYEHLVTEIMQYFVGRIHELYELGVNDIIVDPGFGFAKTRQQNFQLLANLANFKELRVPVLAGLSRKSMIYKTLGITAEKALMGTGVLNTIALMNGASLLRVHDIKAANQTIELFKATYP